MAIAAIQFNLNRDATAPSLIHVKTLWRLVGAFSIFLPIILIVGHIFATGTVGMLSSVSEYYHTEMRNFFVGILSAIAFFLAAYNGYNNEWGWLDRLCSKLACVFVIGIAFFTPLRYGEPLSVIGLLHNICAVCFFILTSIMSLYLFTKTDKQAEGRKKIRNLIYIVCGILMFISIAAIALNEIIFKVKYLNTIFETLALWFFGISWLTKGNAICPD